MNRPTKFKGNLTVELLSDEYNRWVATHGDGRDPASIRFGQYLINKYIRPGQTCTNVFYEESAKLAYTKTLDALYGD